MLCAESRLSSVHLPNSHPIDPLTSTNARSAGALLLEAGCEFLENMCKSLCENVCDVSLLQARGKASLRHAISIKHNKDNPHDQPA